MNTDSTDTYLGIIPFGDTVEYRDGVTGEPLRLMEHPVLDEYAELEVLIRTMETAKTALEFMEGISSSERGHPSNLKWEAIEVALWEAVIIGYCRCFDVNGRYPIDATSYLKNQELSDHQYLYSLRDKHVAHDVNKHREAIAALGVNKEGGIVALHTLFIVATEPSEFVRITANLIEQALKALNQRKQVCGFVAMSVVSRLSPTDVLALPPAVIKATKPADPSSKRKRPERGKGKKR